MREQRAWRTYFHAWRPCGCWSECAGPGGREQAGGGRGLAAEPGGPKGQASGWVALPSVQYNKFTAAGAQQLAASLRKCPHVETLA